MRYGLGDRVRRLVPTMAADAVADHGGPIEGIALARRKAVPADRNPLADTGEGWHHRKRTRSPAAGARSAAPAPPPVAAAPARPG